MTSDQAFAAVGYLARSFSRFPLSNDEQRPYLRLFTKLDAADVQTAIDALTDVQLSPPTSHLDDGDHDRFTHIVLEGFRSEKGGEFVPVSTSVAEGIINSVPVKALCGKVWVPGRDPNRYGLCPTCKEIAEARRWGLPSH